MSDLEDLQKRALELEESGFTVEVIGRAGRLDEEYARFVASQELEAAKALTVTIRLVLPLAETSGPTISNSAVVRMSKLTEELMRAALKRAHDSKRTYVTSEDVQQAWEALHPAGKTA